jgi:hypothetical protein
MGHVVAPELPRVKRREMEPQDTWWLWSCPEPEGGSWSYGTCDGSGATLSQEAGAEATAHVAASKLPSGRWRELAPRDAWQHPSYLCQVA